MRVSLRWKIFGSYSLFYILVVGLSAYLILVECGMHHKVSRQGLERIFDLFFVLMECVTDHGISDTTTYLLLLGLVAVIVGGTAAWLVDRRIKHTLLRMIEAARKLAQGDLEQRVRVNTADEFEELAEAFNQMAEGLQRCQKSVEALHQEQLMRADRLVSLGEMACRIAHEIRNPLAGISGAIQVLSEDPSYDNPEPLFESIQRQVDRLDQVVRDFLRYSDLPPLELKLTDLHEVIERALSWVFISCKGGPIRTVKDFSHALPPVEVDPNQLEQAFVNIFLNALQAMPGGGELRVTTRLLAEEEEAKIVVSIEDTGPGMKPEVLNHIFAPFFTTKHRGTGLGLPIVHQILTRHRASITASSEPQKGSTFTLTFPCRSSEAKGPEEEAPCCGAAPFLEGESVGHRGKGLLFHRPRELSHAVDSKHSDRG